MTDPTLFVTATISAKGPFGGAHDALTAPLFPLVTLERTGEASSRDPLSLFFLSVEGGICLCVVGVKRIIHYWRELSQS